MDFDLDLRCVRAGCQQQKNNGAVLLGVLNTPTLRLGAWNPTTSSASKWFAVSLPSFVCGSLALSHPLKCPLCSCFSHFHSCTFSCSVCLPHPPLLTVCHVVDCPSLRPLQNMRCMEKKVRLSGSPLLAPAPVCTPALLYLVRQIFFRTSCLPL